MKKNIAGKICAALFCAAALLSLAVTWHASGTLLDSDASGELVLAKHLAETGRILSKDWYYSTELRVVNTQLVFAPLFHVFDDWRLVRFFGAVILQGLLVASYYFFTRCAKIPKKDFLLGGALLLTPAGIAYGRIVLYHSYYVPHIALGFVIAGLLLSACREKGRISGALLLIVSFLSGLGGVRQGAITHAPMAVLAFLYLIMSRKKSAKPFVWAIAAGMGALAGVVVNHTALSARYEFMDNGALAFGMAYLDNWKSVLKAILHYFGYRQGTSGWMTALSMCGAAAGMVICGAALAALLRPARGQSLEEFVTARFFAAGTGVLACILLVSNMGQGSSSLRYMAPAAVWAVPMLTAQLHRSKKWMARLRVGLISLLIVSGLVNSGYVFDKDLFAQKYAGIDMYSNPEDARLMGEGAQFLLDEGYTVGYAYVPAGNIMTEITDGALRMVGIAPENGNVVYAGWLTEKNLRNEVPEHTFAVILPGYEESFSKAEGLVKECFRNERCIIYDVVRPDLFRRMLENG